MNVPLCCSCCVLVRCGNPESTSNDEFPLFTADNMTFLCAELFILQQFFCSLWIGYVPAGGGDFPPPLDPLPPPPRPAQASPWGGGAGHGCPPKEGGGGLGKRAVWGPLLYVVFRKTVGGRGSKKKNHLEERLLDQAQARASYTPLFCGHSRSIPQGMIFDIQPLVKSLFCPIRPSPKGFFDSEASIP